jgi:hypothetical protein
MNFTDPHEHALAVEMLRRERAALETPVEHILFDNDPANGSIATRIEVMLTEPDEASFYGSGVYTSEP